MPGLMLPGGLVSFTELGVMGTRKQQAQGLLLWGSRKGREGGAVLENDFSLLFSPSLCKFSFGGI